MSEKIDMEKTANGYIVTTQSDDKFVFLHIEAAFQFIYEYFAGSISAGKTKTILKEQSNEAETNV